MSHSSQPGCLPSPMHLIAAAQVRAGLDLPLDLRKQLKTHVVKKGFSVLGTHFWYPVMLFYRHASKSSEFNVPGRMLRGGCLPVLVYF